MKQILAITAFFCCIPLFAQTEVVNSRDKINFQNGVGYSLPKTILIAKVEAVKTIKAAGPYFRFSERYLGTKDVITENSESWTIRSVTITSKALPDPANRYVVRPELKSAASSLTLTPDGLLCGVNVPLQWEKPAPPPEEQQESATPNLSFSNSVMSGDALQANSTAKMAELAAQQIYRLRENRMNLISGDGDKLPDGKALELMLAQINKSEKELTELFAGKTATASVSLDFEITPDKELNNETLFRLSSITGIVSHDDVSGQPYYISIKDITDPHIKEVQPILQPGLYYRIPGKAAITVTDPSGNVLLRQEQTVAQFGVIQALPVSMFNKTNVKVRIDPTTGALLSVEK